MAFRKNFWAFVGTVVIIAILGAVVCGYFLGIIARTILSVVLFYPIAVLGHIIFGKGLEKSDRLWALKIASPFAIFLAIMWAVALCIT